MHRGEDGRASPRRPARHSMPSAPCPTAGRTARARGSRWPAPPGRGARAPRARGRWRRDLSGVDLAEARVDVPAQRARRRGRDARRGATACAAGCSCRPSRPAVARERAVLGATRTSRGSSRGGTQARARPRGQDARDVLDRVHGEVGAPVEERLLDLLHEEPLAADLGRAAGPGSCPRVVTTCSSTSSRSGVAPPRASRRRRGTGRARGRSGGWRR